MTSPDVSLVLLALISLSDFYFQKVTRTRNKLSGGFEIATSLIPLLGAKKFAGEIRNLPKGFREAHTVWQENAAKAASDAFHKDLRDLFPWGKNEAKSETDLDSFIRELSDEEAGSVWGRGPDENIPQIIPKLPPESPTKPISVDEALTLANEFLDPGIGGRFDSKPGQPGIQYIQDPVVTPDGKTVVKRIGFDFDTNHKHVKGIGFPHLNLQTQFNSKPAPKGSPYYDPHIPVDSNTIKPSDY